MNRLTGGIQVVKDINQALALNKLSQLEDIEEELGIDKGGIRE